MNNINNHKVTIKRVLILIKMYLSLLYNSHKNLKNLYSLVNKHIKVYKISITLMLKLIKYNLKK